MSLGEPPSGGFSLRERQTFRRPFAAPQCVRAAQKKLWVRVLFPDSIAGLFVRGSALRGIRAEMRYSRKSCKRVKVQCTIGPSYPQVIHRLDHEKMGTWAIFALFLLTAGALCASGLAIARVNRAYAVIASVQSQLSALETSERLTPSKLAALSEFKEALTRCEELLIKVNRREIARAKPRDDDGTYAKPVNGATLKDQLRIRAGLRAGLPAPHQ